MCVCMRVCAYVCVCVCVCVYVRVVCFCLISLFSLSSPHRMCPVRWPMLCVHFAVKGTSVSIVVTSNDIYISDG